MVQVLFGILLLVYVPDLDPYPGYAPIQSELVTDTAYGELSCGEQICPERHANIFSSKYLLIDRTLILVNWRIWDIFGVVKCYFVK